MKRNTKERLNVKNSLLLIVLLLVFLIISTYAWFTSNKIVKITDISVEIHAADGFQISFDAILWKTVLDHEDILGQDTLDNYNGVTSGNEQTAENNRLPGNMDPVSTAMGTDATTGYMDMYLGEVMQNDAGDLLLLSTKFDEADKAQESKLEMSMDGSFIAFDLFFKTNSEADIKLLLDRNAGVIDIGTGNRAGKGIENSARVALVEQGYVSRTEMQGLSERAVADLIQPKNDAESVIVWEPNMDKHVDAAKTELRDLFAIPMNDSGWTGQYWYHGLSAEITEANAYGVTFDNLYGSPNSSYFTSTGSGTTPAAGIQKWIATTAGGADTELGIDLKPGVTKFRVYLWLEGQDWDCYDNASGSDIKWQIVFARP